MSSTTPHFLTHDLISGSTLPLTEPKAVPLGNFDTYSFSREINGSMVLVTAVDLILRNKKTFAFDKGVMTKGVMTKVSGVIVLKSGLW